MLSNPVVDLYGREGMYNKIEEALKWMEGNNSTSERSNKANRRRAEIIRKRFQEGKTQKQVLEIYGVIPQRIHEIEHRGLSEIRTFIRNNYDPDEIE